MGVVYRAFDSRLKRNVALKLLAGELAADERFRGRFLRESELAASLDHPNVVPIYEAGESEGLLFIAMRYVEGSDLKERLRPGALSAVETIELTGQIAGALDAAHARGLVHRDVKPSNVLIASGAAARGADHVYLSDFGLTRRLADREQRDGTEPLLATLEYVAPEQIRGDEVDGRADVYSLACVLYECLTGEPPFRAASDAALLYAHLEVEPPQLSGTIDDVLARGLAKDPRDRYRTAGEFVEAAREALGVATPARRPWWRAPALLATAGVALVAVGIASYLVARSPATPPSLGGPNASVGVDAASDSLVRIDPASGRVTGSLPVGHEAKAVAVGAGSIWVAAYGDGLVARIDPKAHRIVGTTNAQGTPTGLAVTGSSVVVADGPFHRAIVVLDAATGAFRYVTALPGPSYDAPLVASGPAGAWFADLDSLSVGDAKPLLGGSSYTPIPIPFGSASVFFRYVGYAGLAVGSGAVWLAGDALDRVVWRIDPRAGRIVSRVRLPFVPRGIAAGDGSVWVSSVLDDTVSRIDPASGRITATISVGRGADKIAVGGGSVWVTDEIDGTVSRIDPRTNRVVGVVAVGRRPRAIAADRSGVWVTVGRA
jgi:serine/threonine-protein kinase